VGVGVPVPFVVNGKVGNHAFGNKKLPAVVPQKVCILWRGMGRQQDFLMDDFALMGIVFLFLVVFGKQPLAALVGSGSNGRPAAAPFDNCYVMVWTRQAVTSFLPVSGQKKSRRPYKDFLLGGITI